MSFVEIAVMSIASWAVLAVGAYFLVGALARRYFQEKERHIGKVISMTKEK